MINKILRLILKREEYITKIIGEIPYLIIIDGENSILNGEKINLQLAPQICGPCEIKNDLIAVWDMRNNDKYWDHIDIICGLYHEMFHCRQILNNIWVKCNKNINSLNISAKEVRMNIIKNNFSFIPEEMFPNINMEGAALYFEMENKAYLKNKKMEDLILEYEIYAEKHNEYMPYYIGALMIYIQSKKGLFNWKDYLNTGYILKEKT